ncbi:hypothetical protein [Sideroxydans lithotrophicus]|uniref:Uncharacterized protein n=1 Tax=Sideroxydans lithotrophicus (strain ES-1) TaxID=580332 RepID=D5CR09_SIDLE|nr:hypothetical protein [Sideroxydans lithotrophicus]ADE11395.1 hypothetical protein Slit_1157 [Sideroxydans lithotrophicus ES-1]
MRFLPGSPAQIAGYLSLLSASLVVAIWLILLFAAIPSNLTVAEAVIDQLHFVFSAENQARLNFIWLAILPLLSILIGSAYLLKLARSKAIAVFLFAATLSIGLIVLAFNPFSLAIIFLLPAFWGWKCIEAFQDQPRTGS